MAENVDAYCAPPPPRALGSAGKRLWRTVAAEWELQTGDEELELLRHAGLAQDMCDKAQKALDSAGSLTFLDRFDKPAERPEVRIIRQSRAAVASLVKQIGASQLAFERLTLATERHRTAEERRDDPHRAARRGGGTRRHG
jgi:hypothetical protein